MRASEVQRVFRIATPSRGKRMVVFSAPGHGGLAAVASRKVGGAVDRNRAKRILRAAWRVTPFEPSEATDVVLVAREGIRGVKTQDLVGEMSELLRAGAKA